MSGVPRTTTQRGYGWEHQKARAAALDALVDGTPCPFCQQPMVRGMALDYDHYPPLALGGGGVRRLAHARCNRQAGQRIAHPTSNPHTTTNVINSRAW